MPKNAFEILEIEPTQDLSLVKTAYKKIALRTHPDKFSASSSDVIVEKDALFKELYSAYEQVNDEEKLANYFQMYPQPTNPKFDSSNKEDMPPWSAFFWSVFYAEMNKSTPEMAECDPEKEDMESDATDRILKRMLAAKDVAEKMEREQQEKDAYIILQKISEERIAAQERAAREYREQREQRKKEEAARAAEMAAEMAASVKIWQERAAAAATAHEQRMAEYDRIALEEKAEREAISERERLEREFQELPEQKALALEQRYNTALVGLTALQFLDHPDISEQVRLFINYVSVLHGEKENISQLIEALEKTRLLLTGQLTHEDYVDRANQMQGRPDVELEELGVTMLKIALVLAVISLAFVLAFLLAPAVISIVYPAVLVPVALIPAVTGIGFFCSGRRQGLSKEMDKVNDVSLPIDRDSTKT